MNRVLVMYLHIAAFALTLIPNDDGTYRLPWSDIPNGLGEPMQCPIPFDPLFLIGQPIGQYHCPYCGSMVIAGFPHPDYIDEIGP